MKNFKKDSEFKNFDGRSFGGKKRFDNKRRSNFGDDRRMVDAVCDKCGRPCKVPFVPTGEKPVYCSDCYEQISGGESRPQRRGRDFGPKRSSSVDLSEINRKLDRILEMLER